MSKVSKTLWLMTVGLLLAVTASTPASAAPQQRAGWATQATVATQSPAGVAPMGYPTCRATDSNLVGAYRYGNYMELDVYWDATHGTNCAYAYLGPAAPRGRVHMLVYLKTCSTRTPGVICGGRQWDRYEDEDEGRYYDYAGKVTVDGRDRCIFAYAAIDIGNDGNFDRFVDSTGLTHLDAVSWRSTHCG